MAYEEMTIEQLEAAIDAKEGIVQTARAEQLQIHNVMEARLRARPVLPTPMDQVMGPGQTDWAQWAKSLPKEAWEAIKKLGEN